MTGTAVRQLLMSLPQVIVTLAEILQVAHSPLKHFQFEFLLFSLLCACPIRRCSSFPLKSTVLAISIFFVLVQFVFRVGVIDNVPAVRESRVI
jgi:hypothetical protein